MNLTKNLDSSLLETNLSNIAEEVSLKRVDDTLRESNWDFLVKKYHYLGYKNMLGRRMKYLIYIGKRVVGAISFCSASYKLGPRDKFIGWDEKTRLEYLPHLLNNNRFLLLPWIKVHNLASHVLSVSINRVRDDWKAEFGVEPYFVETFVDPKKYKGTCYKAADWVHLGPTKGFGRVGNTFIYHGNEKDIYVIVINRRFGKIFKPSKTRLENEREELRTMINSIPYYSNTLMKELKLDEIDRNFINEELTDHLELFIAYLGRSEQKRHFVAMITGLLGDLSHKSTGAINLAYEGPKEVRNSQNFMSKAVFDDAGMLKKYQNQISFLLGHPEGMITGDGCDFEKKGKHSVGVARQYCGRLGKVENCQASVMIGYASPNGYGLIDYDLYIPKLWFQDDHFESRKNCRLPEDIEFKTKNDLLLQLINNYFNSGFFKGKYVGVDSFFGRDYKFLDSLPKELIYFADIPNSHLVFPFRPGMEAPKYKGIGRKPGIKPTINPISVKELIAYQGIKWNNVVLGMGAKGPIIVKDKCFKVVESRNGVPGKDVWLYARKLEDKTIKYAFCNAPMEASIHEVRIPSLMRWSIEQCFKECKEYLGMDQYESRTLTAWRRHILFCFIAHLLLIKLRHKFSVIPENIGPCPFVMSPISLREFRKACKQYIKDDPITVANVEGELTSPQQVMSAGLIKEIVSAFLVKKGQIIQSVEHKLESNAKAYNSHSKKKINRYVLKNAIKTKG